MTDSLPSARSVNARLDAAFAAAAAKAAADAAPVVRFELERRTVYVASAGSTLRFVAAVYRSFPTRSGAVRWGACYGHFEIDNAVSREAALDELAAALQSKGVVVRDDFEAWGLTVRCATKAVRLVAREAAEA